MFINIVNSRLNRHHTARKHLIFCYLLVFQAFFALSILNSKAVDVVNNLSFDLFSQEHGLSNSQVHSVLQDSKGGMWIGTSQGVCRFDGYRFTVFKNDPDDSTSLKGNLVRVIYEDNKGQLYIWTENGGLNKFDREKERFHNFSMKNGFQNDEFTYGAACKLPTGELIFGGISGFNIFDPAKIKSSDYFAPIVFTNLKISDKSVQISEEGKGVLSKSISETDNIKLKYEQNSVELEFALLDFANIMGVQYSYYLEGFDKGWKDPSDKRLAT